MLFIVLFIVDNRNFRYNIEDDKDETNIKTKIK
jgi:hypothetical protein